MGVAAVASGAIAADQSRHAAVKSKPMEATLSAFEFPLHEGDGSGGAFAFLRVNKAPKKNVQFSLSATPAGRVNVTPKVTVRAGKTETTFRVDVINDTIFEGTTTVTLVAKNAGAVVATTDIIVADDEPAQISISLPSTMREGGNVAGTVSLPTTTVSDLKLAFSTTGAGAASISPVPAVIAAGQSSATFTLFVPESTTIGDDCSAMITVSANGCIPGSATIAVDDSTSRNLQLASIPSVIEGTTVTGRVQLTGPVTSPVVVDLTSDDASAVAIPATVTIPTGYAAASFAVSAPEDTVYHANRAVSIHANAATFFNASASVTVLDNDTLSLNVPRNIQEGTSGSGSVSIFKPLSQPLTVQLRCDDDSVVTVPESVTIQPGEISAVFTLSATDNAEGTGPRNAHVVAAATDMLTATATITVADDEIALSLSLPPLIQESRSDRGTVSLPRASSGPLVITFESTNPSALAVPTSVTIPAGETSVQFDLSAPDNDLRDGTRAATVTITAAGCFGTSASIPVRDNDVATYRVTLPADILKLDAPVNVAVTATDVEGNFIDGYAGDVDLSVISPDGSVNPVSPATVSLGGASGWSGNVVMPSPNAFPGRFHVNDANGNTGDALFDVMRVLPLNVFDLVWDEFRHLIYASVPASASGPETNEVVSIDPDTLQIVARVPTGRDPRKLALTNGGEILYVVLDATGEIAQIDPNIMGVASTFSVGSEPNWGDGPWYAQDLCTIAGQPQQLIVSRHSKVADVSTTAVYDTGVMRPNVIAATDRVQPSADPNVVFGFNNRSSSGDVRRIQLDAGGLTQLAAGTDLMFDFYTEIRSLGDTIFGNNGYIVDGENLVRAGKIDVIHSSAVCPDSALNRVYFVDQRSTTSGYQDRIAAFDAQSLFQMRRLSLQTPVAPRGFIRWGQTGLAVANAWSGQESLILVNSSRLVPNDPPADLQVDVTPSSQPAWLGQPLTYNITVANRGPNAAHDVRLVTKFSGDQRVSAMSSSKGALRLNTSTPNEFPYVDLADVDLASGESLQVTLTMSLTYAGKAFCRASVTSDALDPDQTNNVVQKTVDVGAHLLADQFITFDFSINNVVYDAAHNLLWATTVDQPYPNVPKWAPLPPDCLISIDANTMLVRDIIPIGPSIGRRCIAVSDNGAFLYLGANGRTIVFRVAINFTAHTVEQIDLGEDEFGGLIVPQDIVALPGDGTSFLVTGYDSLAEVFDGHSARPIRTRRDSVSRIEKTADPNTFVGYNVQSFYPQWTGNLVKLSLTASGVSVTQTSATSAQGLNYADIAADGNSLLWSTGALFDTSTLNSIGNFGGAVNGAPCVDAQTQRAYLLHDFKLDRFDIAARQQLTSLDLPMNFIAGSVCTRWGIDGLAIVSPYNGLSVLRSSALKP